VEKDGDDQLDRSCKNRRIIIQSQDEMQWKAGRLTESVTSYVGTIF